MLLRGKHAHLPQFADATWVTQKKVVFDPAVDFGHTGHAVPRHGGHRHVAHEGGLDYLWSMRKMLLDPKMSRVINKVEYDTYMERDGKMDADLWHTPTPGPLYWDFLCTQCSTPVGRHPSAWKRLMHNLRKDR